MIRVHRYRTIGGEKICVSCGALHEQRRNGPLWCPGGRVTQVPERVSADVEAFPTVAERDALAFCFRVAVEHHGAAARIRRLLYAWQNGAELGGFDLADLWSLDDEHRRHALAVINMIGRSPQGWYPSHYGYAADFQLLIDVHGPHGNYRVSKCAQCGVETHHFCDAEAQRNAW